MLNQDQRGEINHLTIPFVITLILTLGFGIFSVWAFTNYTEQKNSVDVIVATEVAEAEKTQEAELQAEFEEEQKNPYKTYTSPSRLGSVKIVYAKSWSAYVEEKDTGTATLDGYFHPNFVPDKKSESRFATRVEIDSSDYADVLQSYQRDVEKGELKAVSVTISGTKGTRLDGRIDTEIDGAIVLLPLRDKTLKVWTESTSFLADYNRIIKNLSFSP